MISARFILRVLLPVLIFSPVAGYTQSMSVIGGGSYARNCFMSATLAIQLNSASKESVEECNQAILHGRLTRKDLLATYVNRGILYGAMEDYQKALKDYRTAVELEPVTGEVYVNLGNLYLLSQKYDVAIQQYTTAIELTLAKNHIAHFNRAMAYENNKDYDNAEADYRRAMELSPEWVLPQLRLERMIRNIEKGQT
ncbi:MAG: tetratricopeptide repeat protein [Gammaproteobacteria bacterium]|nr:tetratricopeptide repeat protein [Gammaproteobacteria bacterium]